MALVSGARSSLNPNAPLFVPTAMRQVEDFSPEWWDLVTTSTWFHDYWISQQQHQGEDVFCYEEDSLDYNNVLGLLPDSIDLDVDVDVLNMEAQFEEFLRSSQVVYGPTNGFEGFGKNVDALIKNVKGPMQRGPMEPNKWRLEKPAKYVGPKYSPRSIQQPR